jgi:endonuclease III
VLHQTYGSPHHDNKYDPLDEVVFIILSQMTTHHSFSRVFNRLKSQFPSWDDVRKLTIDELTEAIRDAGLSNQKAPRIKAILDKVQADFGKVCLDRLREMDDHEAERYLVSLPGVGTKTAKCVLMYSLHRAVLPVDTHVWRITQRLGLIDSSLPYSQTHAALEAVVAPEDRYSLHVNALVHGREICRAKRAQCQQCPLKGFCPTAPMVA